MRSSFTEEQLQILQAIFRIESNPDSQELNRISLTAGVSRRVAQVWFQNARARQKKQQLFGNQAIRSNPSGYCKSTQSQFNFYHKMEEDAVPTSIYYIILV